jgi:hypothetical protein
MLRNRFLKVLMALILLIFNNLSQAQKKSNDSLYISGYMNSGEYATKNLTDKGLKLTQDVFIEISTPVFIISSRFYSSSFQYFEVAYQGETYFVYREHVTITNKLHDFNSLLKADKTMIDTIRSNAILASKYIYLKKKEDALKFVNNCRKIGLLISQKSIYDESEYTDGTSFDCEVVNLSKKVIKYITFSIQGYNSVNDKVGATKQLKGIGPISENSSSKYSFKYVWFTDIVESFKIVLIKLQYMDGGIKNITNTELIYDKNNYLGFLD